MKREGGVRALMVGADAERLGRLADPLVREADGVALEFLVAAEPINDRFPGPSVDCVACEVTSGGTPGEFLTALREAAPAVPVVLFAEDERALDAVGVEATDAVVVGPDLAGTDELLVSLETAAGDARRPGWSADGDAPGRTRRGRERVEYERIVETAPIGLATLDPEGRIAWANEVYAETLDRSREELVGTPFLDLVEAGYYEERIVEDYLESVGRLLSSSSDADRASYQVRTHLPDGETLIHDVHTALLPLADGEFDGTVHAFRDVTTRRSYERELERQNERLDAFASVVSHDLRNPLSVAEAYLEVALETGDRDPLETVADAHDRMDALVEDLLSLARNGRAVEEPRPTDLAAVARGAWAAVETGDAALEVGDVGTARADPDRLQQALENLFRNAVEHGARRASARDARGDSVEHGSTDDERAGSDARADPTVTVGPLEDGTGFFVADDGRGIAAGDHGRVFDQGYTTGPAGTGFGLAIVETIVDAHGWSIAAVESEDGGARFEVTGVEWVA